MGTSASKKLAAQCSILNKEEQRFVAQTFRLASRNSEKIRDDDLINYWGPMIDPRLAQFLSNYLFGSGPQKAHSCGFMPFAELFVYNVRGTPDEQMNVLYRSVGMENGGELPFQLLKEYCESLASTYMKILKSCGTESPQAWMKKGFSGKAAQVQALGEAVAASVDPDSDGTKASVTARMLYCWLSTDLLFRNMSETVFLCLYGASANDTPQPIHQLLPTPEGLESMPDYPAFADLSHLVWINAHLPRAHQHKWRFLFSSHIHGESFVTFAGRIIDQGPSVIIVEDKNGYMFGGFASESWNMGPNFYGGEDSFLFSLAPKMRIYPATTFNNHYQYLNQNTKTLPNGLLMGGQFEFGALWVCAEPFGVGSSAESCTTYRNYARLSRDKDFRIKSLEVWGVGDKPLTVRDSNTSVGSTRSSVLDTHKSDKNFLNMIGKPIHSDGFRE